ncbi:MAG: hypothetical protein ACI4TE_06835 [Alphaproteobacteria bacterium]
MENLEVRIQKLEKKYRTLKYLVTGLMCFAAYTGLTGTTMNSSAFAQQKKGQAAKQGEEIDKKDAGIPVVVEAEVFLLKDSAGNIRGVWTADNDTTSFAMMHKDKYPIAAMAVDRKNATLSLTDVYAGKISLGLTDSIRSISIMDDTKKNNIYLGLTGSGEAAFDMVSTGNSAMVIDGATSSLDMSGDTAILALTETVGSAVALKAQPSSSALTFLDYQNKSTVDLTTIDGKTQLKLSSPASKDEKTIVTTPEEILNFNEAMNKALEDDKAGSPDAAAPETSGEKKDGDKSENKKDEKKEENKVVNMKTYSPFSK